MANSLKGEVEIKAGDVTHVLRLSVAALIHLEGVFGKNINRVLRENFADLDSLLIGDMARVIRAGMIKGEHVPSEAEAVAVMDAAGLAASGEAIGKLLSLTFPPDPPSADKNPR